MKKLLLLLSVTGILGITSCTKTETASAPTQTIHYTVQVVTGGDLAGKKDGLNGLTGATVTTNQAGSIKTVTTDASGLAAFVLNPGVVAVTVSAPNQTTLNYQAQLSDSQIVSYNSTMAALFPISGAGTATVTGKAFAQLDRTTQNAQSAPDGTGINVYLNPSNLQNYVNVLTGQGQILKVAYESASFRTTVSGGTYSLTLPATSTGLSLILKGDEFEYNVITGLNTTQRTILTTNNSNISLTTLSGQKQVQDVFFQ